MSEQTPRPHQQAVIDAVVGLANSLLRWGRGAGQTWTRQEIARRIIADDDINRPVDLSRVFPSEHYPECNEGCAGDDHLLLGENP